MEHAKAAVPGLVEMTLDRLVHELTHPQVEKAVRDARVVIIRSQEIDGAGESLPDGVARRVMGTVLEDLRKGVLRLAAAGIEQFVITADHGHLYGERRGDDMMIGLRPLAAGAQQHPVNGHLLGLGQLREQHGIDVAEEVSDRGIRQHRLGLADSRRNDRETLLAGLRHRPATDRRTG